MSLSYTEGVDYPRTRDDKIIMCFVSIIEMDAVFDTTGDAYDSDTVGKPTDLFLEESIGLCDCYE